MPLSKRELLPVERRDDLRALAPHITYVGLFRWFNALDEREQDMRWSRRAVSEAGTRYEVLLRAHRVLMKTVSIQMLPLNQPGTSVFFRGRQSSHVDTATGRLITKNGRIVDYPVDLLSREELAWRRDVGGALDLIAPGTAIRSSNNPAIITVGSHQPLTVADAETLVFDAAPVDPDIVGPTYTIVPLF